MDDAWLAGSCGRGDLAPGPALLIHQLAVGVCCKTVATRAEVVAASAEGLQEPLRMFG